MIKSPLGWLGVVETPKGIAALLRERGKRSLLRRKILLRYPTAIQKRGNLFRKTEAYVCDYFKGKQTPPLLPLDLSSRTPFQKRVLTLVRQIPCGTVRTYRWVAKRIRCPGGSRACGQALHQNPLPLLIPCHRIVMTSKGIGGFAWGKKVKKQLLRLESSSERKPLW
ncbi:MAG: methylated-DNA--[protein]-cysteine S-methyltransferase [Candidatus Omnitrophica bacterium]|nr:methylated-DNA--[protein]-cysteine S-methyltransferase [Candidatus Omnitrophota bacterium]